MGKGAAIMFCFLVITAILFAQPPDTMWTRQYDCLYCEVGRAVQVTHDGGFIIVGSTGTTYQVRDIYLVRTDANGDTLWTRRFGGSGDERSWSGVQTTDRGFAIGGYTESFGAGDYDFYLVKTDSVGDTLWTRTYGGPGEDACFSVQQTFDNGFIMAGRTESFGAGDYDFYAVKTDSNGDTLWTRTYGGTEKDICAAVQQTNDSGYIFVGGTESYGDTIYDAYIIKTDMLGDTLWTKKYGGHDMDVGRAVQQTFDNGYIIAGYTCSYGQGLDVYLLRTDTNGDTLWARVWGGTSAERGISVVEMPDGNFAVACDDYRDYGVYNDCDIWLLKVDTNGDTLWTTWFGDSLHDDDAGAIVRTSDGGYAIVGTRSPYASTSNDFYLVRTTPDPLGIREHWVSPIVDNLLGPTIFSGTLVLPEEKNCRIFDITGRVVSPDKMRPGIYFIEIDGQISKKVVKVK